jgi:metal-responsive CopG/Arc/MetJ family transcriptional regulator
MGGKKNFSISLDKPIFDKVEGFKEEADFSNRSKAIQYIIEVYFGETEEANSILRLSEKLGNIEVDKLVRTIEILERADNLDQDQTNQVNDTVTNDQNQNIVQTSQEEQDDGYKFSDGTDKRLIEEMYEVYEYDAEAVKEQLKNSDDFERLEQAFNEVVEAYE